MPRPAIAPTVTEIVIYVTGNGGHRPAHVTGYWDDEAGNCGLTIITNGETDAGLIVQRPDINPTSASPCVAIGNANGAPAAYDPAGAPGTWHQA